MRGLQGTLGGLVPAPAFADGWHDGLGLDRVRIRWRVAEGEAGKGECELEGVGELHDWGFRYVRVKLFDIVFRCLCFNVRQSSSSCEWR